MPRPPVPSHLTWASQYSTLAPSLCRRFLGQLPLVDVPSLGQMPGGEATTQWLSAIQSVPDASTMSVSARPLGTGQGFRERVRP